MIEPWVVYKAAPLTGPFGARASLGAGVTSAPAEGIWVPVEFLKNFSVELSGTFSGASVQLYASNQGVEPGNSITITIGGTVATGDVLTINFVSPIVGTVPVTYTTVAGDTATTIAAAFAAAINALATNPNAAFQGLGVSASSSAGVITIDWPSIATKAQAPNDMPAGFNVSVTEPVFANFLSFTTSTTGSETFTLANGTTGQTLGAAITAAGFTQFPGTAVRWIKARFTALTSGSADVNFAGVG